jgi:hypothetical protein
VKIYAVSPEEVAAVLAVPVLAQYEDLRVLVAHSIAISYEEKLGILYGLPTFAVYQIIALYEIFEEEQRHFKEINDRYARGVASLTIRPHIIN